MEIETFRDATVIDFYPYPAPYPAFPSFRDEHYQYVIPTELYILVRHYFSRKLYYPGVVIRRDAKGKQTELLTFFGEGRYTVEDAYKQLAHRKTLVHDPDSKPLHASNVLPLTGTIAALDASEGLVYEDYAACVHAAVESIEPELMERIKVRKASRGEIYEVVCRTYRGTATWREWVTDELLDGTIQKTLDLRNQSR